MTYLPFTTYNAPFDCPRCGDRCPGYPALSRVDNKTFICADCGSEEALQQFFGTRGMGQGLQPVEAWAYPEAADAQVEADPETPVVEHTVETA